MRKLTLLLPLVAAVAACSSSPKVITRDTPVEVKVPIPQPCASERPEAPTALNEAISADIWDTFDIVQKVAHIGAQGLERQTYGEQLHAATAACPAVSGFHR